MIGQSRSEISNWQRAVKRILDLFVISFGLVFLSPVFLSIAILIILDSPGSVLYKQKRIGENGQPFTMFKFRSMKKGSNESVHKAYTTRLIRENTNPVYGRYSRGRSLKMENDPRITRVGRFIRRTSLDELPQIFNVLRGEMSLVGPRPPLPYELEVYQEWHKRRLVVPPGITGLWQVKARNQVSFEEMVQMDLEYIDNYSLFLDIKLILETPWAIIRAKGAG